MSSDGPEQFRGWLLKWTNYIKGYQKRWFVLANGMLSYYRTQEEMSHTCRGTINLAAASIDKIDSTHFVITSGPSQIYYICTHNEAERQRWVTALELAKSRAIKKLDFDDSDNPSGSEDESGAVVHKNPLATLQEKLKELNSAYDVVAKNSHQLSKFASDLEGGGSGSASVKPKEKLALLKLTSGTMLKAAKEFMVQARRTERRWSRAFQHERSLRHQLQENLETLANQMHGLEDEARVSIGPVSPDKKMKASAKSQESLECDQSGDDDKFFDAPEMSVEEWKTVVADAAQSPSTDTEEERFILADTAAIKSSEASSKEKLPQIPLDKKMTVPDGPSESFFNGCRVVSERRTRIPSKPSHKLSLWSIIKNSIGKDITKIPMPVNFNEPLSMLQRMAEDLAYSELLSKGANAPNTMEEAAYVAAFVNSAYASTTSRTGKPFNPLLYETFEYDRRSDLGWRLITEQVSHHPPAFAMHVEHKEWTFWQEYTVSFKFHGKYVVCYPLGCCHLVMHRSQSHYTWSKIITTVHNIIVGTFWIDQSGELRIINHTSGEECRVKYHAYSYFSREQQRKITGTVMDSTGTPRYVIRGHWDEEFILARVVLGKGATMQTTNPQRLWQVEPPCEGSEAMYGFSKFACSLNEPEDGVAPTDCRLRPDIRTMEQQDFDKANAEKVKLEEKQRARRRKREAFATMAAEAAAAGNEEEAKRLERESTIRPVWFAKEYDHLTNTMMSVYKGGYWEAKEKGNWDEPDLPDIF